MSMSSDTLYAVFSYRFDAHLVPDLLRNIDFVDGYVANDDRQNPAEWFSEGDVRRRLIADARAQGADWVLVIDPDERLEPAAGDQIRAFMRAHQGERVIGGFRVRELWSATHFRVDGVWGHKRRWGLFPVTGPVTMTDKPVHGEPYPLDPDFRRIMLDVDLFHLKMMSARARRARRDLYNRLDPDRLYQAIGYDYLAEEDDMELVAIEPARRFRPRRPAWWLRHQVHRAIAPIER